MKLSAPKKIVFLIAVIAAIVAVVAMYVTIPVVSGFATYLLMAAFVLLALGNLLKGF